MQIPRTTSPHPYLSVNGNLLTPDTVKPPDKLNQTGTETDSKLSSSDQQVIQQLKNRDREVRAHEAAHLAAAGGLATGGASYSYQLGPDGQSYAIGGEVGINISPVSGDPAATLAKAETIKRAALAPAHPSGQDFMVAQAASAMAQQAKMELVSLNQQKTQAYAKHAGSEQTDSQTSRINIST